MLTLDADSITKRFDRLARGYGAATLSTGSAWFIGLGRVSALSLGT